MLSMLKIFPKIKIFHSKLKTELFIVAIHIGFIGLNKIKFLHQVQLCQGSLEWRQ